MTRGTKKTVKFNSDTEYAMFEEAAIWRHADNYMARSAARREIEFEGEVDPHLYQVADQFGGTWRT